MHLGVKHRDALPVPHATSAEQKVTSAPGSRAGGTCSWLAVPSGQLLQLSEPQFPCLRG